METIISPPCCFLPPEILEIIFGHLGDPSDLLHVMRTCTQWERILEPEKPIILLLNAFPIVSKHLSHKDILSCRQLCKRLKMTIDQLVERCHLMPSYSKGPHFSDLYWDPDALNSSFKQWLTSCYTFPLSSHIPEKFNCMMDTHMGNPFIGRSASFTFFADLLNFHHYQNASYESFMHFLTRFGHHLRKFTHSLPMVITGHPENVQILSRVSISAMLHLPTIFRYLSQLEYLNLDWFMDSRKHSSNTFSLQEYEDDILGGSRISFPPMKTLTGLNFNVVGKYSVGFGLCLLRKYGLQLKSFACTASFLESDNINITILNELLPNVKHFKLIDVTPVGLEKLSRVHWRLEHLQLQSSGNGRQKVVISDLGKTLESFGDTLVKLQIDVQLNACEGTDEHWTFQLSKLKQFGTLMSNLKGSTWLLNKMQVTCRNLEVLDCHLDYDPEKERRSHTVLARSLQEIMPTLKKVRVWHGYFKVYES